MRHILPTNHFIFQFSKGNFFKSVLIIFCLGFQAPRSVLGFSNTHEVFLPTTTTVDPLPTVCSSETAIILSATVSPDPEGGTIQFQIDGTNVGTAASVINGAASVNYNVSALALGNHVVKAIFSGNGSYSTSTSSDVVLSVNGVNPGLIAKGASAQGPACASLNPNITLVPNGTTSTAATGNGTITYVWQQSLDGGLTWTDPDGTATLPANTSVQFNPKSMTATTRLRRMAISTLNSIACSAYSNELEYIVYQVPVVASIIAATYSVCEGSTLQLTNATPGGIWSSNNLESVTIDALGLVKGISASASSSSNVSYKVTDGNGCSKNVNRTIAVKALPVLTSRPSACNGETFQLTPGTAGTWTSSNTSVATVTNAGLATAVGIGTASFTYTYNTAPRCANTTQITTVSASPLAAITSENVEICAGQSTTIKGNVTATGNWTVILNDGSTATGTDNGSFEIVVNPTINQNYNITSLSSSSCNAKPVDLTGTTSIIVKPIPAVPTVTTPIEYCKDMVATQLTATGTDLFWYETIAGGTGNGLAPTPQTSVAGVTNYYVSQTINGCESEKAGIAVNVKDCEAMPVTLVEFILKNNENAVQVTWKTTSEINSSHFEIERSINPVKGFEKITTIASQDNENGASYVYLDSNVITSKTIYYRLKMIDQDKTFTYSRIQNITSNQSFATVLYPNPASQELNIETYDWKNVTGLKVLDMNGNVKYQTWREKVASKLKVVQLPDGLYFIKIIRKSGKSELKRFMVAH